MNFEIITTDDFNKWLKNLKDRSAKTKILARLTRLLHGNFGDVKRVDAGLFELRFFFGAGYRIYYTTQQRKVILLLVGGDKSTQTKDILKAKKMLEHLESIL